MYFNKHMYTNRPTASTVSWSHLNLGWITKCLRYEKRIGHKNNAHCLLTKVTKLEIAKYSGPDVSILAGPFSKAEWQGHNTYCTNMGWTGHTWQTEDKGGNWYIEIKGKDRDCGWGFSKVEDKGGKLVGEIKEVDRQWGLDWAGEINEERRKASGRDQRGGQAFKLGTSWLLCRMKLLQTFPIQYNCKWCATKSTNSRLYPSVLAFYSQPQGRHVAALRHLLA